MLVLIIMKMLLKMKMKKLLKAIDLNQKFKEIKKKIIILKKKTILLIIMKN